MASEFRVESVVQVMHLAEHSAMVCPMSVQHLPQQFPDHRQRLVHVGVMYLEDMVDQLMERCRVPVLLSGCRPGRCFNQGRFDVAHEIREYRLALWCRLGQTFSTAATVVDAILLEDLSGLREAADKIPNRRISVYLN
jgi:hypothetical protein